MGSQMLSHPDEIGAQSFRTYMVEAFADDLECPVNFKTIRTISLPGSLFSREFAVDRSQQAFSVELGDGLHFVQQFAAFFPGGFPISFLHFP
ncbi:MAG: hypothetical protein P8Z41_12420 [Anaerolineales bacterium]